MRWPEESPRRRWHRSSSHKNYSELLSATSLHDDSRYLIGHWELHSTKMHASLLSLYLPGIMEYILPVEIMISGDDPDDGNPVKALVHTLELLFDAHRRYQGRAEWRAPPFMAGAERAGPQRLGWGAWASIATEIRGGFVWPSVVPSLS